jgi:Zn-dependent metalloprotease
MLFLTLGPNGVGLTPGAQAISLTLNPEADAYTRSNANLNLEATPTLSVRYQAVPDVGFVTHYSYLRFNLDPIPPRATIQSAQLQLYLVQWDGTTPSPVRVHGLSQSWDESVIRWSNQPPPGLIVATQSIPASVGYKTWDVTALVQAWVNGDLANEGLVLTPGTQQQFELIFNSREAGNNRPRLIIEYTTPAPLDPQVEALRRLEQNSRRRPEIRFERGIPTFVAVQVRVPPLLPDDPVVRALDFLQQYKDLYRLQSPSCQLFLNQVVTDRLGPHVFFGQHQGGIPVFGAELGVHLEGNNIMSTNGNYLPEIPSLPPPTVLSHEALAIAIGDVGDSGAEASSDPTLMYFNGSLLSNESAETHLAWRVTLWARGTSWLYFVDAYDGEILLRLDQSHNGDRPGEDFDIESVGGASESSSCWLLTSEDDAWFDEDGPVSTRVDAEGNLAFNFTHTVYHYFYDTFSRRSYDGDEEDIEVYLDVVFDTLGPNARYNNRCDIFEYSDGFAKLDIMAHEFTHGVDATSRDLIYMNQSGAIDESFADFFGAMVDPDWTIGEDLAGGTLRDMSNPPSFSSMGFAHPDHNSLFVVTTADNGGVHINSGIPNKAAFLITDGGTHRGRIVTGIGRAKAQRLYYDVLTTRVTSSTTFIQLRDLMIEQARAYIHARLYGFTLRDVCSIMRAFNSVGLGPNDMDCDGLSDQEDTDDDGDYNLDSEDNCPTVANSGQDDFDGDGIGDACDPDDDNDGILDDGDGSGRVGDNPCSRGNTRNCDDNCRLVANPDQADDDRDGIGELCDDDDGDGWVNPRDNCPDPNPDQTDTDGDGMGDACDPDDDNDGVPDVTDNCRLRPNPNQQDTDGDGWGDICDLCPTTPDGTNIDTDRDGVGDACDEDDDNDGICDRGGPLPGGSDGVPVGGCERGRRGVDNCRLVANPHQIDIDDNGMGLLCDADEAFILTGVPRHVIEGFLQFQEPYRVLRIPIAPCADDRCPDRLPEGYRTEVEVQLPFEAPARIIDDQGRVVAKAKRGADKVLSFRPDAAFFSRTQGCAPSSVFQGRRYYLELLAAPGVPVGQGFRIHLRVESRLQQSKQEGR